MRLTRPAMTGIHHWQISTKLALVVAVLSIPIAVLLFVEYRSQQDSIHFAESESDGLDYVSTALPLLRDVQNHRGLNERWLRGDRNTQAALAQSGAAVEADLASLLEMDSRFGKRFGTAEYIGVIRDQWAKVKDALDGTAPEISSAGHTSIIESGIMPLLAKVGTESRLFVDPSVDSRAVIFALTDSLPKMTESLAAARSLGSQILVQRDGQFASDDQKQTMIQTLTSAGIHADAMVASLETAMAENEEYRVALGPLVQKSSVTRDNFVGTATREVVVSRTLTASSNESFFLLGGSAIDSSNEILKASQSVLQADFAERTAGANQSLWFSSGIALIGVLLAVFLAMVLARSITGPISRLVEVADRMSLGELEVEIDVEGDNEIGHLAESLRRMQASLRSAIERLRIRRAA